MRNDPLRDLVTQAARYPLLTSDQMAALAARIKRGDKSAREKLTLHNLLLVVSIAKRYRGMGLEIEDLFGEGLRGLVRAVDLFDPAKGAFSTIASYWIKTAIRHALDATSTLVRVSTFGLELLSRWRKASEGLREELGREATEAEVAARLRLNSRQVECVRAAMRAREGAEQLTEALLEEEPEPIRALEARETAREVGAALDRLPRRWAEVMRLRYGIGRTVQSQCAIGRGIGMSRQDVQEIETQAIGGLRHRLAAT